MKSCKSLVTMIFLMTIAQSIYAGFTTSAGSKVAIYNQSNVAITVNWVGAAGIITSGSIPANTVGSIVYKKDTYSSCNVVYAVTPADPVTISFAPTAIATAIYVYGNGSVTMGTLDSTNTATPLPSRYIAWWTGNINTTASTSNTVALAQTDATTNGLVKIYMASVDGKNSLLAF